MSLIISIYDIISVLNKNKERIKREIVESSHAHLRDGMPGFGRIEAGPSALIPKWRSVKMEYCLGMDIGGTKTAVVLYDRGFRRVGRTEMSTEPERGCRELVGRMAAAAFALLKEKDADMSSVSAAGVACPGPLDLRQGRIVYIPTMGFAGEPLAAMLEEALGLPVALENDTNAAALCESIFGKGRGRELVAYITVSTGVGCGIVHDRRIVDGAAFAAGELGHFKVVRNGRSCSCGGQGCLEAYASGTAVARIASERYGRTMDAKAVYALARQGDEPACAVVREAAEHLGYAVAAVYQLLDPDIVVLGGSVTRDYDVFGELLLASAASFIQPVPGRAVRLAVSEFDGEQVALGAAWYAAQKRGLTAAE